MTPARSDDKEASARDKFDAQRERAYCRLAALPPGSLVVTRPLIRSYSPHPGGA